LKVAAENWHIAYLMENELKYFASLKLVTIVEYKVQNAKRYPIMA
jgi:hypothetical protein